MTELAAIPPSTRFDPSAPVPEEYDVFCEGCGYSLVGLTADKCPECGRPVEPAALPYARVPWLHRRRIGYLRGYWQTVVNVVRRPRAFAEELCRPVRISADDARRFRRVTTYLTAISVVVAVLTGSLLKYGWGTPFSRWEDAAAFLLMVLVGFVGCVYFLRLATDMPVFIWRQLPGMPPTELAPLHHYAAAPLALAPLVAAVVIGLPFFANLVFAPPRVVSLSVALGLATVVAWVYVCWRTPLVLMRAATGCDRRRVRMLGAYLPVHWLVMAVLMFLAATTVLLLGMSLIQPMR